MTANTTQQRHAGPSLGRGANAALWVLQGVTALGFVMTAAMKFTAAPQIVRLFEAMGAGLWLVYLVGALEVAGAVALFVPRLRGLAALAFVALTAGAVVTHLVVGGSPAFAAILGVFAAVIAWARRRETADLVRLARRWILRR